MSITYTYEVFKVDPKSRCMEVIYSSPGRQSLHVGARLPYVGESLESVIKMFSPVNYWLSQEMEVVDVPVGTTGSITE